MNRVIWGFVMLTVVVGCAPIQPPEPTAHHPASPEASQAEDAEMSDVLAIDGKDLPQTPPEMRRGAMHHDRGQSDGQKPRADSPQADQEVGYTCSMHPDVMAAQPGKCPECGMDLVPVRKGWRADE